MNEKNIGATYVAQNKRRNPILCLYRKQKRQNEGEKRELAQLDRETEEKEKSLTMTSLSSVSQLNTQSVVMPGNSYPAVDIEMKPADNDSAYMVTVNQI